MKKVQIKCEVPAAHTTSAESVLFIDSDNTFDVQYQFIPE